MSREVVGEVSRIYQSGFVDGPGNRLVIYLQGCNFRCLNCHNSHTIGICIDCGNCSRVCKSGALQFAEGRRIYVPERCVGCDLCLSACPMSANPQSQIMSVELLVEIIKKYSPFIDGITFTGGEPTTQWEYVSQVSLRVQEQGRTVYLDSNGNTETRVWEKLAPTADGVMLDIKAMDEQVHLSLTGSSHARVLKSAYWLAEHRKLHHVRHLIIPGITDDESSFMTLASFVAQLPSEAPGIPLVLLPFRPHGVRGELRRKQATTTEQLQKFASIAKSSGVRNVTIRPI